MSYIPNVMGVQPLRAVGTALATTFDAAGTNPEIRIAQMNTISLCCDLALNTATSVEIIVEVASPQNGPGTRLEPAPVAADWFQLSSANLAGLTTAAGATTIPYGASYVQLGATGKYCITFTGICAKYFRVRAKTTGGPGTTTLAITGVEGLA